MPADGLLLAPEGGGGCVCGGWLETSAALAPRTDFALFRTRRQQFLGEMEVELEPPVGVGLVHYTTDGSEPTERSMVYQRPIRITETTTIRTRVYGADALAGGPEVAARFERLSAPSYLAAGRVEFQPVTIGGGASGDLVDYGEPLKLQANGHVYGWLDDSFSGFSAVDSPKRTDPVRQSLVWLNSRSRWEMAVENGEYNVTLLVGNPEGETKQKDAGAILIADGMVELDRDLAKGELAEISVRVRVSDGKLTLSKSPEDRTSVGISWLRFSKAGQEPHAEP